MGFDLLKLHCPKEDSIVRKLLRIYSVVPRFSNGATLPQTRQAIRINQFLRKANKKLNILVGFKWKNDWLNSTGYNYAKGTHKDWFIGRASIPLIALKRLEMFGFKDEVENLIENSDFFCSTTGDVFKLPHEVNPELAYLVGAILGDGHIKKASDKINFEVSEDWLAKKFMKKVKQVFEHNLNLGSRIDRGKLRQGVFFNNKPALRVFTKFFHIPRGKKSHKIIVPNIIKNSDRKIKLAFLEGVFDTDGCIRKKGFRLTTASVQFRDDLCELLESLGEKGYKDEWINKKYNKKYYGLQYSIKNLSFIAGVG